MKYLRTVPLLKDESLSSWLIRSSLYQGCDTLTFTSKIWGKYRVWTVDFERQMNVDRLQALSKITGITCEQLNETLLVHTAKQYSDSFNAENSIWLWVISQGIRNRKKSVGQPFCPQCFVENTPYLRREWRMAWATCCNKHHSQLQDCCPECGFLYVPSKLTGFEQVLSICHHCGHDMRTNHNFPAFSTVQSAIADGLENGFAYQKRKCSMAVWLATLRGFISIIRKAVAAPTSHVAAMVSDLGIELSSIKAPASKGTFEWLPITERHSLLEAAYLLMQKDTNTLVAAAHSHKVTANSIRNILNNTVPDTLSGILDSLHIQNKPYVPRTKSTKPLSEEAIMRKWALLLRKVDRISSS